MTPAEGREESGEKLQLRLFVSGATPRSMRAIAVVRKLCEAASAEGYDLEVIDIYQDPVAARDNQIVALPTLVKMSPVPRRMFIGDMSDIGPLEAGLGLTGDAGLVLSADAGLGLTGDDERR